MNRYDFLNLVWNITNTYDHHITTELLAITIADQYVLKNVDTFYSKELAYVVSVMAAKVNEEGHGLKSMKRVSDILNNKIVYYMEHDILRTVSIHSNFVTQLSNICIMLNITKLSSSFVFLLRYLEWCNVTHYSFFTIVFALQLLKNKHPIYHYIKYFKVYNMFVELSELYEIDMYKLITLYNQNKND